MEWATLKLNFRLKSHTSHNIYSPLDGGEWIYYNYATEGFHTKNFVANFIRLVLVFDIEPPFAGLRGNVCTPSIARWKARGRLPISTPANSAFPRRIYVLVNRIPLSWPGIPLFDGRVRWKVTEAVNQSQKPRKNVHPRHKTSKIFGPVVSSPMRTPLALGVYLTYSELRAPSFSSSRNHSPPSAAFPRHCSCLEQFRLSV